VDPGSGADLVAGVKEVKARLAVATVLGALLACEASPSPPRVSGPAEEPGATLAARIPPPPGFERIPLGKGSFGAWLRELPLRPGRSEVLLHDGRRKRNQNAHFAVVDLDVGEADLQQCADAVIRLRAEYLFAGPCRDEIQFDFTSGDPARWKDWRAGQRPRVQGDRVSWHPTAPADASYANFRRYLDSVFTYAGTVSLQRELTPVEDPADPEPGDVLIQGGFPGHAVIVVDVAQNRAEDRVFLLAQSFMPAQDIHVLKSFEEYDPWYRAKSGGILRTPEWEFRFEDLRRFRPTSCEREVRGEDGTGSRP
jgi:hypothetical protein